jgi:predicted nuclease of predicted toxin-antitoxin system
VRLLLDEHHANEIAERLREGGHDVVTVSERGLRGSNDESLLVLCAAERRALVTNNVRDFVTLARTWGASGREHAGLLFTADVSVPRHKGGIGRLVGGLAAIPDAHPADGELADQIRWLG